MEKFTINYNNGIVEVIEVASLEEAQAIAVEGMAYTQQNVTIEQDGEVVVTSTWYGVKADEDFDVLADFGECGFYGDWF